MYIIDMPLSKHYQIIIKDNLLFDIGNEIKKIYNKQNVYVITDRRVAKYYLDN